MATRLIYDGTAQDHEDTPAIPMKGSDGKAMKRKYLHPAKRRFFARETYNLWGLELPKGKEVEVPQALLDRGIVKKAEALKCFKVLADSEEAKPADKAKGAKPMADEETPAGLLSVAVPDDDIPADEDAETPAPKKVGRWGRKTKGDDE